MVSNELVSVHATSCEGLIGESVLLSFANSVEEIDIINGMDRNGVADRMSAAVAVNGSQRIGGIGCGLHQKSVVVPYCPGRSLK